MKVHVFTFEFPRLRMGELTHREVETFIIETIVAPLLSYVFSPSTGRWYQHIESRHSQGTKRSFKFNQLKPHEVPKLIKTHCLLLEVA